jgi:hypothetical protein
MGKCALLLDDGSCKVEFINETAGGPVSTGNRPTDVQIKESVGLHGRNVFEDVYKVQYALNKVPPIDGGPPTPIKIDGKCGPQTIKTIQNFQLKHFGWSGADGRIDPGKRTHKKLIEVSGRYDVYPSLPLDMVNDAWFFAAMMQHVPFTKQCIHAAMAKILSAMNGGLFGAEALNLLNRHFLIDKNPSPSAAMQKIYDHYGYMLNVLNRPDNYFTLDTDNRGETISTVAFARLGGFFETDKNGNKVTNGRIVFRRGAYFATQIPDFAAFVFIHELRHFVEREGQSGHFGKGWVTDPGMQALSAKDRLANCDTYGGFALESKHGIMDRPGWVKSSVFR